MPPTEQYWAEKEIKKEKQIAYFNSVNATVELLKNEKVESKEQGRKAFKEVRDWLYSEWEKWYADNIVEPQGADGEEEEVIQTKLN